MDPAKAKVNSVLSVIVQTVALHSYQTHSMLCHMRTAARATNAAALTWTRVTARRTLHTPARSASLRLNDNTTAAAATSKSAAAATTAAHVATTAVASSSSI